MIIILSGEAYQIERTIQAMRQEKVREGYEPHAFDASQSPEDTAEALSLLLRAQGLFQKRKIGIVRHAPLPLIKTIVKNHKEESVDTLIISTPKKVSLKATKGVTIKHFAAPQGPALRAFLDQELQQRNAAHSDALCDIVSRLSLYRGSDLFFLSNELEKFSLAPHHTLNLAALPRDANPFAISDALARRDRAELLTLLERELREGVKPFDIINRILWQIRVLILVQNYSANTGYTLKLHPFVIKKARQALRQFSISELRAFYEEAISLYGQLLFSGLPGEVLLSRFFWKI